MKTALPAIVAALMIAAALGSCAIRKSEPITGKVVDNSDLHIRNGQVLFMTYCHKCHPMGESGLGPAVNDKPNFAVKFQVRHGMGVMPYFKKDQISREDLQDISKYLKQLKHL